MSKPNITLITLQEPMMYLEGLFKPSNRPGVNLRHSYAINNFNTIPYMVKLLNEITSENFVTSVGTLPDSTLFLIKNGMPEHVAVQTGLILFKMAVDIISEAVPEMCFNKTSSEYTFDFMGNYDLAITWTQDKGIIKNVFD